MGGIDHEIVPAGFGHAPLHVVRTRQLTHGAEQQRMVGNDEVAIVGDGLVDHGLRDVDAEQCATRRLVDVAHLKARMVVRLLQRGRCEALYFT